MVEKGRWRILACVVAVLLIAAICTAVSVNNYVSGLNRVVISSSVSKRFHITQDGTGSIHFSQTETLTVPEGCSVEQWLVSAGDNFTKGDALAKVSLTQLKETLYTTLIQLDALSAVQAGTENECLLRDAKKETLQSRADALQVLMDAYGILYAPADGQVIGISSELTYGVRAGGFCVQWLLSAEQYREYTQYTFVVRDQTFSSKKVAVSFDAATNRYLLRAEVSLDGSFVPLHGEPVQISMGCITAQYDSVIPKRAIYTDKDGYTFVYLVRERDTVLGKENYLDKVGVTIVDSYQYDVAVLARLENFVVNCSREPADLEAVLVLQSE